MVAVTEEREPRGARRKRETRARLLDAALRLMAQKGMEGVAINEITEAADVGFGSFYNHFESKEAIYATLVESVFEEFADSLDRLASGLSDPAEIISVSVRHTLMRARREPVGALPDTRGFFGAGPDARSWSAPVARHRARHRRERFVVADPFIGFLSLGGTVLTAIAAELNFVAPGAPAVNVLKELGFSGEHFPERTAATLLHMRKRAEAEKIASRPLPVVEAVEPAQS